MEDEILQNAKMLLSIEDDSADAILAFYIEDIVNAIISRCRIEFLPTQLAGLAAMAAARMYKGNSEGDIKSLAEGDRKVEYTGCSELLEREYAERLKPFMNISGRVPTDLDSDTDGEDEENADG